MQCPFLLMTCFIALIDLFFFESHNSQLDQCSQHHTDMIMNQVLYHTYPVYCKFPLSAGWAVLVSTNTVPSCFITHDCQISRDYESRTTYVTTRPTNHYQPYQHYSITQLTNITPLLSLPLYTSTTQLTNITPLSTLLVLLSYPAYHACTITQLTVNIIALATLPSLLTIPPYITQLTNITSLCACVCTNVEFKLTACTATSMSRWESAIRIKPFSGAYYMWLSHTVAIVCGCFPRLDY